MRTIETTFIDGFDTFVRYDRVLWLVVICFFGIGDLLTTGLGMQSSRVVEAGPVAIQVVHRYGIVGMLGLKLIFIETFYQLWKLLDDPYRVGIPLALSVTGVIITVWNVCVLYVSVYSGTY